MSGKMITGHVADFSSQNIALIIPGIEATVSIRARIMEKLKVPTVAFYEYALLASIIGRRIRK
jgi:hypothetical protein